VINSSKKASKGKKIQWCWLSRALSFSEKETKSDKAHEKSSIGDRSSGKQCKWYLFKRKSCSNFNMIVA
jgi:hypothetical protein